MLGDISSHWKQVIAYHFTNGQSDGAALAELILEIMHKKEELGLSLVSMTFDIGSFNISMWKSFGVVSGKYSKIKSSVTHLCDDSRQIYFIADVSH